MSKRSARRFDMLRTGFDKLSPNGFRLNGFCRLTAIWYQSLG
ncbi:hypothetical protein ABIE13_002666 [Ottowia thiooxydans]|uniref:Uncharacterized protein n=1 Tax=Ottowia thiooxydans TaxID=219182 RepID=A0ABV2Q973_9BURK